MISVYAIILNWNRKVDTIECLKSIAKTKKSGFNLTTVVVDNASTDGSVDEIKKFVNNQDTILIVNDSNLGFAAGNNVGINYALFHSAEYILVLNNDTRLDVNLLHELVEAASKSPRGGAFSPKIYFEKGYEFHKKRYSESDLGKVIWAAGGIMDWNNVYGINRGVDEVDAGQYDKSLNIEFATGACVLYSASALKKVGVFDEKYFMYYEDVDLSIRLARAGFAIHFVPKAVLWHKVAQSSGIGSGLNDYFIARNRMLFGLKYASVRTILALFRESIKLLRKGRAWQRIGIKDFYLSKFGKGSWK